MASINEMFEDNLMIERIKECMDEHGDTMASLAKKVGVSRAAVLKWMRGEVQNIKLPIIKKMATMYAVSPLWLIGDHVPKYPETESHASKRNMISDMLVNVKESDLDRLLVITEAFVETAKKEAEAERKQRKEQKSK